MTKPIAVIDSIRARNDETAKMLEKVNVASVANALLHQLETNEMLAMEIDKCRQKMNKKTPPKKIAAKK
jgi:hypothetical protein